MKPASQDDCWQTLDEPFQEFENAALPSGVQLIVSLLTFVPAACSSFRSFPHVVNSLCITFQTMDLAACLLTLRR